MRLADPAALVVAGLLMCLVMTVVGVELWKFSLAPVVGIAWWYGAKPTRFASLPILCLRLTAVSTGIPNLIRDA